MSPAEIDAWSAAIGRIGFTAGLVGAGIGLFRGWWIPGFWHRDRMQELRDQISVLTADRDKWQQLALKGTDLVEAAVGGIRSVSQKAGHD